MPALGDLARLDVDAPPGRERVVTALRSYEWFAMELPEGVPRGRNRRRELNLSVPTGDAHSACE
jgi:hypothetical protein